MLADKEILCQRLKNRSCCYLPGHFLIYLLKKGASSLHFLRNSIHKYSINDVLIL